MSATVRVLLLSWEYPPLVVGGLGRHVEALAQQLAGDGHDVRVITRGDRPEASTEMHAGVHVVRAAVDPLAIDFTTESLLAWAQAAEHALLRAALPLLGHWRPDVVHAHDWLVAQSAITAAGHCGVPLVATLHATEYGRNQGWLPRPLNLAIHSVERWLAMRADEVITCSSAMRAEVTNLFDLAPERIEVIGNGIDAARWQPTRGAAAQARREHRTEAPLLVFAGRLVHEKGVQTLIDALPALRRTHPGLRLLVVGTGNHERPLRALAAKRRVARAVEWLGFVAEERLPGILAAADAVVLPSLYEPFGIVALEAAIAGAPLVVAKTGGLRDLHRVGVAAAAFEPGDATMLTDAVLGVLADPAAAARAARRARRIVRRDYTWSAVAAHTLQVYDRAITASSGGL